MAGVLHVTKINVRVSASPPVRHVDLGEAPHATIRIQKSLRVGDRQRFDLTFFLMFDPFRAQAGLLCVKSSSVV